MSHAIVNTVKTSNMIKNDLNRLYFSNGKPEEWGNRSLSIEADGMRDGIALTVHGLDREGL